MFTWKIMNKVGNVILRQKCCEDRRWIELAQDHVRWRVSFVTDFKNWVLLTEYVSSHKNSHLRSEFYHRITWVIVEVMLNCPIPTAISYLQHVCNSVTNCKS